MTVNYRDFFKKIFLVVKQNRRYRYMFVWSFTLLGLFIVLPYVLIASGFSRTVTLSFVIGLVAILSDGLLTKIGLRQKRSEVNLLFMVLKGRVKEDYMIVLSRLVGIILLSCILFWFNDAFLLLTFALCSMVCVIANAITLGWKFSK